MRGSIPSIAIRRWFLPFLPIKNLKFFSQEEVMGIATRWTNVLRTGSVAAKFVAVDFGTLMFTMDRGQDILEVGGSLLAIFNSLEHLKMQES